MTPADPVPTEGATQRLAPTPSTPPCVAALDMGYGHLRAAAAIAAACGTSVVEADRPPFASAEEARSWRRARGWYEGLTRSVDAWYAPGARRLLDLVTSIPDGANVARETAPNFAARSLHKFVSRGLGAELAAHLRNTGAPLVATFYAPALAAEAHGAERVHCVVTDTDVNRVWVPLDPARTRITYCVPIEPTAARLRGYGVPADRIRVTGFPLPPELVPDDGRPSTMPSPALAARLRRLDPQGVFRAAHPELDLSAGPRDDARRPPTLVLAVGGAGAQVADARRLLAAMREPLRRGAWRVVAVAGTRPRVADAFRRTIDAIGVAGAAEVLSADAFAAYHRRFNETLERADVLWTKPSELTFYAALGIPLLLAPPLGVHEHRNRAYALSLGAAIDAGGGRKAAARLEERLIDGGLAEAAWAGYRGMARDGTLRILEIVARV